MEQRTLTNKLGITLVALFALFVVVLFILHQSSALTSVQAPVTNATPPHVSLDTWQLLQEPNDTIGDTRITLYQHNSSSSVVVIPSMAAFSQTIAQELRPNDPTANTFWRLTLADVPTTGDDIYFSISRPYGGDNLIAFNLNTHEHHLLTNSEGGGSVSFSLDGSREVFQQPDPTASSTENFYDNQLLVTCLATNVKFTAITLGHRLTTDANSSEVERVSHVVWLDDNTIEFPVYRAVPASSVDTQYYQFLKTETLHVPSC